MKKKSKIPVVYMLVCIYMTFSAFEMLEKSEITIPQKLSYLFLILVPLSLTILSVWQKNTRLEFFSYPALAVYFPVGIGSLFLGIGLGALSLEIGLNFGVPIVIASGILGLAVALIGFNRIRNLTAPETLISIDLPADEAEKIQKRMPYEKFKKFRLLPDPEMVSEKGPAPSGQAPHLVISRDPLLFNRMKEKRRLAVLHGESPKELPAHLKDPDRNWCGVLVNPIVVAIDPQGWKKVIGSDPEPLKSFDTLLSPNLVGSFVLPDPEHSDAGFLFLAGLVQHRGEEAGLAFMAELKKQAARLVKDPINVREIFADPKIIAAVGFLHDFLEARSMKFKLSLSAPEGTSWEMVSAGIPTDSPSLEQSNEFLEFLVGKSGNEIFGCKSLLIPTHPHALTPFGSPVIDENSLNASFNIQTALAGRDDLLRKWRHQ